MGYVEQTLTGNEKIEYVAKYHWLYTAGAISILILFGPFLVGIYIFFAMMITKWTTEIVLTSDRLIYKKGWIARSTEEIALDRIEAVNVKQSVLGRIFEFGKLTVSGVGEGKIELPTIDAPLDFRKALLELRARGEGDT